VLTIGSREALCVGVFALLVWAAHTVLRLIAPLAHADRVRLGPLRSGSLLICVAAFALGAALGRLFVYPAALRFAVDVPRTALLWNATVGPGLVLLAAPLAFHAVRPRLGNPDQPARRFIWMTPLTMLAAAIATPTTDVFHMTVVFLPMCVGCMAGVGSAELAAAVAKQSTLPMSRVLIWGVRFGAESLLGAAAAILLLTR
jgi:Sec-independent protein secretion pathway component TatC